jgi:transcriptional regulator with XRE-family HTH domain
VSGQGTGRIRDLVAANLRRAQEQRGLTARQLADAVGAAPEQVSKWRRAELMPSLAYLIRLAEVLDVDVAYFYAEQEEVPA